jgi:tRNA threonylcarbamoyladenosine biosynthesis protein TsaE
MNIHTYKDLSLEKFNQFGKSLGEKLRGGETLVFSSDLGGGKTTLTKSIVLGLGSKDDATSPSFTILNEYKGRLHVYHFDFYRLSDPGIIKHQLSEVVHDNSSVVIIEWADIVEGVLPEDVVRINILKTEKDERDIELIVPKDKEYLL